MPSDSAAASKQTCMACSRTASHKLNKLAHAEKSGRGGGLRRRRRGRRPRRQRYCGRTLKEPRCGSPTPRAFTGGAGQSPPTSRRCKSPWLAIGQSLAPWIIRIRPEDLPGPGTQPDERAACAGLACGSAAAWRVDPRRPQRRCQRVVLVPSDPGLLLSDLFLD